MKDPYTHITRAGGSFACINSGKGFVSYFDTFLEKIQFLYIIKGGPGTGKSGLMAYIARKAEERGEDVWRIWCSSDPDSLDGVILRKRQIAIVDGTAPHVAEPHIPGVDSEILNLGAFWDGKKLQEHRRTVEKLNQEKSDAYGRAFSLLRAAESLLEVHINLLSRYINKESMARTVKRILCTDGLRCEPSPVLTVPLCSIGMQGSICLEPYIQEAKKILTLPRFYGVDLLLLEELRKNAEKFGIAALVSPDPLTLYPDSLYLVKKGILIRRGEPLSLTNEKALSLRRLAALPKGDEKKYLRELEKRENDLWNLAQKEFIGISKHHFEIEKIYGSAMDFSAVDRAKETLEESVFS